MMSGPERNRMPPLGWGLLFLVGLGGWLFFLLGGEALRAWRALLINFLFFTPLAAGLVVWSAIVLAARGRWHGPLERLNLSGCAFALPSLIILAALGIGSPFWFPWYGVELPQGLWLDAAFLFGRDFAALAIFWATAFWYRSRRERGGGGWSAPVLVLVYCLVFTLLGFDLIMALDPQWYSALFGGYFFISGLYIAVAAWTVLAVFKASPDAEKLHDLGKLILAFSILTTYMMFSQLLPIWYENLPHETRFLLPRMHFQPWTAISAVLLATVWLGPLVLLLTVRAKRSRAYLGAVALMVLAGMWLERYWLVAPSFEEALPLGLAELSMAAAMAGVVGLSLGFHLAKVSPSSFFSYGRGEK